MPDDIWSAWDRAASPAPRPGLLAQPAGLPAPEDIPPRAWLYGTRLVRGFVSLLVAPGGVGKSALALTQAVALASGRDLLDEHVHHSVPAWIMNLEDPADELDRRLAACLRLHRVDRAAVAGRLFVHHGRARRLCLARADAGGHMAAPDRDAVAEQAAAHGVGLIVVDPFVKSHEIDENDNAQMDAAATAWAEVAERADAAVLLVHHTRKAGAHHAPGDVESARGAKALSDAARNASVLSAMAAEEAEQLGVARSDRWRYVRLDDAKANMAPRADAARWYRLETVALGNGSTLYPHGDNVAALAPWRPAGLWAGLDIRALNACLDQIASGPGLGQLYTASRRGGGGRWAGAVLIDEMGLTDTVAARVIEAWLRSGLLTQVTYHDPAQRRPRAGLRVDDTRRPTTPTTPRTGDDE